MHFTEDEQLGVMESSLIILKHLFQFGLTPILAACISNPVKQKHLVKK